MGAIKVLEEEYNQRDGKRRHLQTIETYPGHVERNLDNEGAADVAGADVELEDAGQVVLQVEVRRRAAKKF